MTDLKKQNDALQRQLDFMIDTWAKDMSCSACVRIRSKGAQKEATYCQYTTRCREIVKAWVVEKGGG
jgi:hypothetical protein